jgi:pimeloyl-ACP methyl ester carboxylesterase
MVQWGSLAGILALVLLTAAATGGRDRRSPSGTPASASRQAMPADETAASQHVSVGDVQIAYREWGRGEPLLLITGFGATMDIWDPVLVIELAAHYRVIVFDNRGLGGTTAPAADFSIEQLADDTAGLMGALGLERAHVLGYSMGGYVAQELLLKYPQRVTRLVLMGTGCGGGEGIAPRAEVLQALSDMSGSIDEVIQRVISVLVPDDWGSSHGTYLRGILLRPTEPPSPESLARQRQAMDSWQGTCERLSAVHAPTLVLSGTADQVLPPANAMLLVNRIPGAWLAQFPGGGHGMQYQYPKQIAATIHAFLQAP